MPAFANKIGGQQVLIDQATSTNVDPMMTPTQTADHHAKLAQLHATQAILKVDHDTLGALHETYMCGLAADIATERLVKQARDEGATWQAIGDQLDLSPQGAQQRFGKVSK